MAEPLTLMAVHAHPDDEASGGGILAASGGQSLYRAVLILIWLALLSSLPMLSAQEQDAAAVDACTDLRFLMRADTTPDRLKLQAAVPSLNFCPRWQTTTTLLPRYSGAQLPMAR